jgi:Tol biopolymer transport system component
MKSRIGILSCFLAVALWGCGDGVAPWRGPSAPILYSSNVDGVGWDVYRIDFDGSDRRSLTPGVLNDLLPSLSPDRTQIAFFSTRDPAGLWVMGPNGESPRLWLAFHRFTSACSGPDISSCTRDWDIFVVGSNGTGLRNLT